MLASTGTLRPIFSPRSGLEPLPSSDRRSTPWRIAASRKKLKARQNYQFGTVSMPMRAQYEAT